MFYSRRTTCHAQMSSNEIVRPSPAVNARKQYDRHEYTRLHAAGRKIITVLLAHRSMQNTFNSSSICRHTF